MFQDEAGFGRINKPKYCWYGKGFRPCVPCHHIREYRYAYGAVDQQTGESFFLILLVADGAAWHKSKGLIVPRNIEIFPLLPYTPEMNPIEQIRKELRKRGFKNEIFQALDKVVDHLCNTICSLNNNIIKSITGRQWTLSMF